MPVEDQGITPDRYTIIPRTLIFIFHNDQVLLLKGSQQKRVWPGLFNGIGGHIERGEDYLSAARRELKEETGLAIPNLQLVGIALVDAAQPVGIGLFILKGEFEEGKLVASEEGELQWVLVDKLDSYPIVEDLSIILPRIYGMDKDQPPFSAVYHYEDNGKLSIGFSD